MIADDRVRYVGEPLAIVIADSQAQAEDAADRVLADIEPLPVVADCQASLRNEHLLFEAAGTNVGVQYSGKKGEAGVKGPYVRRERFSTQRHSAVTLEARGLVARWDGPGQRMTVFGAAKVPFFHAQDAGAGAMDLPLESVDRSKWDVGGGFGVRGEVYPEDFLVPFAARRLERPVKWIEDRRENLLGSNHSRQMECELEIVLRARRPLLLAHPRRDLSSTAGAYMRT